MTEVSNIKKPPNFVFCNSGSDLFSMDKDERRYRAVWDAANPERSSPAPHTTATPGEPMQLDINAAPTITFIGEDGSTLPDDTGAVAFTLPQYGLMFALAAVTAKNWDDAITQGKACTLLGHADWQAPSVKELSLLTNPAQELPATWPELAKHTPHDRLYWSRTPDASNAGFAWCVYFSYGYVDDSRRDDKGFVRPVRRVPASQ